VFGGQIEPDEEPEDTAIRVTKEELGLTLRAPLPLVAHRIDRGQERFFYSAPLPVALEDLLPVEGRTVALVPIAKLDSYEIMPVHRRVLDIFAARQRGG
jgi:8-oxo-dGTP pyrophosphatase MutT (NUDIX family)